MKKIVLILLLAICYQMWVNIGPEDRPDSLLRLVRTLNIFGSSVEINFHQPPHFTETNLASVFPNLYFGCDNEASDLGDRVCWGYISSFNGVPAKNVAFFFKNGVYQSLRIELPNSSHPQLKSYLDNQHTYFGISKASKQEVGQQLGIWLVKEGYLVTTVDRPLYNESALLLWRHSYANGLYSPRKKSSFNG